MTKTQLLLLLVEALALQAPVWGAEWTVSKSGGADFVSLQAAVAGSSPGDTIIVVDSATYAEEVAFERRNLISVPAGAGIAGRLTVGGDEQSSSSVEGFRFADIPAAINFAGSGADEGTSIGILNVRNCDFSNIEQNGILLNWANGGRLNISGCSFTSCGANGLALFRNCQVEVVDSTFELNGLGGSGEAGIFVDGAGNAPQRVIALRDVRFSQNLNGIKSWRRMNLQGMRVTIESSFLQGIVVDGAGDGSAIVLTDSEVAANNDRGILANRRVNLLVSSSRIADNGSQGILVEDMSGGVTGATGVLISNSVLEGNGGRAVDVVAKGAFPVAVVATDSVFSGAADRLFSCRSLDAARILYVMERNRFSQANSSGLNVLAWHSAANSKIAVNLIDGGFVGLGVTEGPLSCYHNTIVNGGAAGVVVSNNSGGSLMDFRNNIVAQCGGGILAAGDGTGFGSCTMDYNLVKVDGAGVAISPAFTVGSHNNTVDGPSFVGGSAVVGGGNYLLETGSAARSAGDPAAAQATDLNGHAYLPTSPDLGAYTGTSGADDWRSY